MANLKENRQKIKEEFTYFLSKVVKSSRFSKESGDSLGESSISSYLLFIEKELALPMVSPPWLTVHYLERDLTRGILVGYYRSEKQLQWILGNNDKGSLVYNVRLKLRDDEARDGAHSAYFYEKQNVHFVILYTDGVEETGEYRVFHVKDTAGKVTEERMRNTWYPLETVDENDGGAKRNYFFYRFDEEVNIGKIDIRKLLSDLKAAHLKEFNSYVPGEPMFTTAEVLKEYRK